MVHERIKALRERLEQRKQKVKSKRRAKARSRRRGAKAREQAEKERRIQQGDPRGLREHARTVAREGRQTAQEAGEAVSAERALLAQELGVSTAHANEVAESAMDMFDTAREAGVSMQEFDIDGDGDTDMLQRLDQPLDQAADDRVDWTEPVMDIGGSLDDPLFNEDVAVDIDPSEPSAGEIEVGEPRETTTTMAPSGWNKVVDDSTQLQFKSDGEGFIVANKLASGDWRITARGQFGRRTLGTKSTKKAAASRMKQYMRNHKPDPGGLGLNAESSTESGILDVDPLAEDDDIGL